MRVNHILTLFNQVFGSRRCPYPGG